MDEGDYYRTQPRRSPFGLWVALVLLAFVGGVVLSAYAIRHWDRIGTLVRPVPVAAPVQAQPVAQLPAPVSAAPATVDPALTDRVDTIEEQVETIDKRAAAASSDADRAEGMLVALAARRALDRGLPLGYLEGLLRQHFGGTEPQAVATIIGAAQRPVLLIQLQDELGALASKLEVPTAAPGFWSGFKRAMGGLFVIRRADQPSMLPSDRQARAAHALDQGQVNIAMTEVARMPGSAKAADWMEKARRYVMARNALDRIEAAALLRPGPAVGVSQ
ncbi:hypothetical protein FHS31_001754 [Sphingomonas vulcanisoli]|uniref:Uncharacterized protein n=1 Tax=Sphingomonas vulcanisoli TaxID=1658060 RepID=A0ABX0TTT1_9SPHN|nr:hypothetical protein [Sphingomonas vulcanisoli]NIJ08144.1 hypothetical protein [Sphingomonas vulcanisoli]